VSEPDRGRSALGLAHVASCSFLASRLAPSGQFFLALGGGVALARTAALEGLRAGYGASIAAMVQTVALIGPARFNAPLTQALNAPVIGWMQARGAGRAARLAACLAIRLTHYALLNVIFVTLVVGGLDEYVATYDKVAGWLHFLPKGQTAAVLLTVAGSIVYGLAFSTIQVLVCERALDRWPPGEEHAAPDTPLTARERPRRVFLAPALVAIAWVAMLAHLTWPVLAAVGAGLLLVGVGTDARRAGRTVWGVGFVLAAVLALGAMIPALIGAVDLEPAGERAVRAALMVLTATWARAFAGSDGLREFGRRILWGESARLIAQLESDARLRPAADDLIERLGKVDTKPVPLADALTEWVAAEARGYRPPG
jgi:hypothetical protein